MRTHGLSELRRPETTGELIQFLQAINWMRTSLSKLAELETPLHGLLEQCLCNTRRTKRVAAARRAIDSVEWTDESAAAWDSVRPRVSEAVPPKHAKPGFSVMMFPDASVKFWGSCITQIPTVELRGNVSIADMFHDPLGTMSGPCRCSQKRWGTVDKEGFAIVSTFKRLPYLLWGGVAIPCDNRKLAYIVLVRTERPHPRRWHNVYKDGVCFLNSSRTLSCTSLATRTAGGTYCRLG